MVGERRKIVDLWRSGQAAALATLVRIEGSSYRKVAAKLLIAKDGSYVGAISGGCLEAEIVQKAQWLTRQGAVVERYSTLFDDTAEVPYGLGCGGTIDVLIEPAGTSEFEALMQACEASLAGQSMQVQTVLPGAGSTLHRRIWAREGGDLEAAEDPRGLVFKSASWPRDCSRAQFTDSLDVPQRLWVFGAGDDALPLVSMAALLGWTVIVVDGRSQLARPQRFPAAAGVLAASSLPQLQKSGFCLRSTDAAVIMTHSYEQDRSWLSALLPYAPKYLGLLGARHRSALLVSEVAAQLGSSVERACESVFAPVGLDLGGDGAEAIALAVLAEMHAVCEGKIASSKRMTRNVVEQQIATGGASRYLQTQCAL